jgi:hypothetical protein
MESQKHFEPPPQTWAWRSALVMGLSPIDLRGMAGVVCELIEGSDQNVCSDCSAGIGKLTARLALGRQQAGKAADMESLRSS